MEDAAELPREEIEAAKRRGYIKGLSSGLLTVSVPCALWGAFRSFADLAKFEEVFKQTKVTIPALTLLVFEAHDFVGAGLLMGLAACAFVTSRWGDRRKIVLVNAGFLFLCLAWLTLFTVAMQAPLMSIFEAIGQKHH
jgi:hypothetical protein